MAAAATDFFTEVGSPGTATTLAAPGHSIAGTTFTVVSTSGWPTNTGVIFAVDNYTLQTVNGVPNTAVRTPNTYTEWEGVVASSTQITGAVLRYGTDQNYSAGSLTRVYIPVASSRENRIVQGLISAGLTQAGGMGAIAPTSVTSTGTITAASFVQTGAGSANGWNVGVPAPNTVTYNGNRSYSMVFNASDQTGVLSPGMRLRTTRTVAAPIQCANLNGTTQFFSKTSPAGMTFTTAATVMAWVKPASFAQGGIESRYNGTNGWLFFTNASGQLVFQAGNSGNSLTYQSVPLNKWVHVAATYSAGTVIYYIDGVVVPSSGTAAASLTQAGNLEVGSFNGGTNPFSGKIAQAAVFSAVLSQSTIQSYMSQGLAGTETNLISAYSFNNTLNDLNTTNANNLTNNNAASITTADAPWGGQGNGTISSTLDYGIVQSATFSTNTTLVVQVPEGCTIPTSGGVSSVVYSSNAAPYGFPKQKAKWTLRVDMRMNLPLGTIASTWYSGASTNSGSFTLNLPTGEWQLGYDVSLFSIRSGSADNRNNLITLSTSNNSESDKSFTTYAGVGVLASTAGFGVMHSRTLPVSVSTATPYYVLAQSLNAVTTLEITTGPGYSPGFITAENAYI